ncbi:hypothetical protein NC651_021497 [Populus alba x Populus x berolinensis]|nr:hypothetical protein NC651_021497 [Populus alba x Populus x berolinensis]
MVHLNCCHQPPPFNLIKATSLDTLACLLSSPPSHRPYTVSLSSGLSLPAAALDPTRLICNLCARVSVVTMTPGLLSSFHLPGFSGLCFSKLLGHSIPFNSRWYWLQAAVADLKPSQPITDNHVYYTVTSRYTITKKSTFLQKPIQLTICHVNKVPSIPPAHASN